MAAVLKFPAGASAGCNAPEAECLGHGMTTEKPLTKCEVRVDAGGDLHIYTGLFLSTSDAVIDALERFGEAGEPLQIKVRKVTA